MLKTSNSELAGAPRSIGDTWHEYTMALGERSLKEERRGGVEGWLGCKTMSMDCLPGPSKCQVPGYFKEVLYDERIESLEIVQNDNQTSCVVI